MWVQSLLAAVCCIFGVGMWVATGVLIGVSAPTLDLSSGVVVKECECLGGFKTCGIKEGERILVLPSSGEVPYFTICDSTSCRQVGKGDVSSVLVCNP